MRWYKISYSSFSGVSSLELNAEFYRLIRDPKYCSKITNSWILLLQPYLGAAAPLRYTNDYYDIIYRYHEMSTKNIKDAAQAALEFSN